MINVLVNGCNGKMGKIVCNLIQKSDKFSIVCGIDKDINSNFSFPVYTDIVDIIETPDIIIDFSIPEATFKILEYAKDKNIPIVIATTGFSEKDINTFKEYSKYIPIFQSANMSFDIMIMKKLVSWLAPLLKNTDIEIIESHHNRKIDSPSRYSTNVSR